MHNNNRMMVIISDLFSFWQTLVTRKLDFFFGFQKCKLEKKMLIFLQKNSQTFETKKTEKKKNPGPINFQNPQNVHQCTTIQGSPARKHSLSLLIFYLIFITLLLLLFVRDLRLCLFLCYRLLWLFFLAVQFH